MEEQDKAVRAQSLAIARCYPMKNREQDIMPCKYELSFLKWENICDCDIFSSVV